MKKLTAEELKEMAQKNGVTRIIERKCSICGHPIGWIISEGKLYFDSNCDCVSYRSQPIEETWEYFVERYNNATDLNNVEYINFINSQLKIS